MRWEVVIVIALYLLYSTPLPLLGHVLNTLIIVNLCYGHLCQDQCFHMLLYYILTGKW